MDKYEEVQNMFNLLESGNDDEFKSFMDKTNINIEVKNGGGETTLIVASRKGLHRVVQYLVDRKADLERRDRENFTALHLAAHYGHFKACKILIKAGANLHTTDDRYHSCPLISAVYWGYTNTVQLLCTQLTSVSGIVAKFGYGPLTLASHRGYTHIVRILLRHKADKEERTTSGITPMIAAASQGHKEIVEILIQHHASVNAKTNTGETPIHSAATFGSREVVLTLLEKGASVNKGNSNGDTSLHLACNRGNLDVVEVLLRHGADPNKQGQHKRTPLHHAALRKNTNLMMLLLQHDADIDMLDIDGNTALEILSGRESFKRSIPRLDRPYTEPRGSPTTKKVIYEMKNGRSLMNAFLQLCRRQFPLARGLVKIKFQQESFWPQRSGFMQILSKDRHQTNWILISTIDCRPGTIRVFDPKSTEKLYSLATHRKFASQIRYTDTDRGFLKIEIMEVKQTSLPQDSGHLVMAYATDLLWGQCPTSAEYKDDTQLKKHANNCLRMRDLTPFPRKDKKLNPQNNKELVLPPIKGYKFQVKPDYSLKPTMLCRQKRKYEIELHCICHMPYDNTMINCCNRYCARPFHPSCLFGNIPLPETKDGQPTLVCFDCSAQTQKNLIDLQNPNLNNPNLKYDVFVSYSHSDIHFVRHIFMDHLDRREGGGRYELLISERDWKAGPYKLDNVVDSLAQSVKAVAIISQGFLNEHFTHYEWQMMVYHKLNATAVILLDPIEDLEMSGYMRTLLASKQYLRWTDDPEGKALFWQRLEHFLGTPLQQLRFEMELTKNNR